MKKYEMKISRKAVIKMLNFFYEFYKQTNNNEIIMRQKDIALKVGISRKYTTDIIKFLKNNYYISAEYRHTKPSIIKINIEKINELMSENINI